MSYHYGANYGMVIPFNEDTAEKMGVLEEFKLLVETDLEEDSIMRLEDQYGVRQDALTEDRIDVAIEKIIEALDNTFGKRVDLLHVSGDLVETGNIITEEGLLFFFFEHDDFYDCIPNHLFLSLKEKGLEPKFDSWVTGG